MLQKPASPDRAPRPWLPKEDDFLRLRAGVCGLRYCVIQLRPRTEEEVVKRLRELKIVPLVGRRRGKWTERDDNLIGAALRELVLLTNFQVSALLKRGGELNKAGALEVLDLPVVPALKEAAESAQDALLRRAVHFGPKSFEGMGRANGSYHTWTTEQEADLEAELLSLAARYGCTPHSVASRMKTVAGRLAEEVRNG